MIPARRPFGGGVIAIKAGLKSPPSGRAQTKVDFSRRSPPRQR